MTSHSPRALAIAVLSIPVLAAAQVTVHGAAAVEVLHVAGVKAGATLGSLNKLDNSQVTTSRLGLRGVEDLGDGLSALYGLESQIGLDTGAANSAKFWNRGSYVGLRGSMGTITVGRLWGVNDDIMGRYFNFGGYAVFRYTEFAHISALVDNAVKVVSPAIGGFQARALLAAGEGASGRTVEVGGNYVVGRFEAGATYRHAKGSNGQADALSTLGASYSVGDVRLRGGVSAAAPRATGLPKARAQALGVVWTSSPKLVGSIDYVRRDQRGTANDSAFTRLGADYLLSKRTMLFGTLVALKNKGLAAEKFYGEGAAGQRQDVTSLGLKHWF